MADERVVTVELTTEEVRMLIRAIGARIDRLTAARSGGQIAGTELDRLIERGRVILDKLGRALDGS